MLQTDPTQWVNQHSQVIKNLNVLDREVHSSSELGVYVQSRDVFGQPTVTFVDDFTRTQLEQHPETLLTASGLVSTVSQLSDVPGAPHLTPTVGRRAQRVRRRAARHPALDRLAERHRDEHHLPHRTERARRPRQGRARDPRDRASAGERSGRRRRASRSSVSGCSTTSKRTA